MILLTGAAGFIGSNILQALGRDGHRDVIAVDDLTDGRKCVSLVSEGFADFLSLAELKEAIAADRLPRLSAICHQGACADTTAVDGQAVMFANYSFSKEMLALAERHRCPLVYASSASVYGDGRNGFRETAECERPTSPYAVSKWAFDQYLRRRYETTPLPIPIFGLRYFNVYGPGESHKGRMASVAWHCFEAIRQDEAPKVFAGSKRFLRDFVCVEDVVAVNLHFLRSRTPGLAILNVGTGVPRSFWELAALVAASAGGPSPVEIPFPVDLRGHYQAYSCADLSSLRAAGYVAAMESLEDGIAAYGRALSGTVRDLPVHRGPVKVRRACG